MHHGPFIGYSSGARTKRLQSGGKSQGDHLPLLFSLQCPSVLVGADIPEMICHVPPVSRTQAFSSDQTFSSSAERSLANRADLDD